MSEKKTNAFSSSYGFIITIIGFAVGMGTIWRFPYLVGENGGCLFLLLYVVLLTVVGIPVVCAEVSIGFKTQKTAIKAYQELSPGKPWYLAGVVHVIAVILLSYAMTINGWAMEYLWLSITGAFKSLDASGVAALFGEVAGDRNRVLMFTLIYVALVGVILAGGVKKGMERLNKIGLPILGIIMLILIIVGLRMPGSMAGVSYLLRPDFEHFTIGSLQTALGQTFFALGVGMLVLMVFGSYMKNPQQNIGKSTVTTAIALVIAGVMAGFMIFPALLASGYQPAAGPGLTFISLPNVFNQMAGGQLFSILFYFGFIVAMLTSTIGAREAVVGFIMDQFNIKRWKAIALTLTVTTLVAVIAIYSDAVFNFLDKFVANYLFTLGALVICIFCGWVWGIDNCVAATNVKSKFSQNWLKVMIKYVCPLLIAFIFISQFF